VPRGQPFHDPVPAVQARTREHNPEAAVARGTAPVDMVG
jgi:hypothetical protein